METGLQEKNYIGIFTMISFQKIKKIIKEENGKRISKKAINKLDKMLEKNMREMIKKAVRNANFSGRKTIKEEDVLEIID